MKTLSKIRLYLHKVALKLTCKLIQDGRASKASFLQSKFVSKHFQNVKKFLVKQSKTSLPYLKICSFTLLGTLKRIGFLIASLFLAAFLRCRCKLHIAAGKRT